MNFRQSRESVPETLSAAYTLTAADDQFEICAAHEQPTLRLLVHGSNSALTLNRHRPSNLNYLQEKDRGYPHVSGIWSPGYFHLALSPDGDDGVEGTIVASTESWETVRALTPIDAINAETSRRAQLLALADSDAQSGIPAELVLAADQFIVTRPGGSRRPRGPKPPAMRCGR